MALFAGNTRAKTSLRPRRGLSRSRALRQRGAGCARITIEVPLVKPGVRLTIATFRRLPTAQKTCRAGPLAARPKPRH
jgi:hypothetical protein